MRDVNGIKRIDLFAESETPTFFYVGDKYDFEIIKRSEGFIISEVVYTRAYDQISNDGTTRLIYWAKQWKEPTYYDMVLILGDSGIKYWVPAPIVYPDEFVLDEDKNVQYEDSEEEIEEVEY